MASYNSTTFIGNVTKDPEMKMTPKGTAIASFGIAVNEKRKDASGNSVDDTLFLDCEAYGKTAENIGQYVKRGNPLFIEGRLKIDKWEKDGQKHQRVKIVVSEMRLLGGGKREETAIPARQSAPKTGPKPAAATGNDPDLDVAADEIPF